MNNRSTSRISSAAVGSSRMSTLQCRRSALGIAQPIDTDTRIEREAKLCDLVPRRCPHSFSVDDAHAQYALNRRVAECEVFRNRQRRYKLQSLRNGHDSCGNRIARAGEGHPLSIKEDLAVIGL